MISLIFRREDAIGFRRSIVLIESRSESAESLKIYYADDAASNILLEVRTPSHKPGDGS